jgi:hypothetical protein
MVKELLKEDGISVTIILARSIEIVFRMDAPPTSFHIRLLYQIYLKGIVRDKDFMDYLKLIIIEYKNCPIEILAKVISQSLKARKHGIPVHVKGVDQLVYDFLEQGDRFYFTYKSPPLEY